jgi:hypothetical protein
VFEVAPLPHRSNHTNPVALHPRESGVGAASNRRSHAASAHIAASTSRRTPKRSIRASEGVLAAVRAASDAVDAQNGVRTPHRRPYAAFIRSAGGVRTPAKICAADERLGRYDGAG